MKLSSLINRSLFLLLFTCITVILSAQKQTQYSDYEPEVGQPGKDVIWVPTPYELVNKMLEIAKITPEDFVIDLGSGDGRTVIAAAKLGTRALGIEYNPEMVTLSKKNAVEAGVSGMTEFIEVDLFECDLSEATVITMFLLPQINLRLRPELLNLKPGTRIVSNTFSMGEWEPDYEATTDENWNSWYTSLMWIVPAKVNGTWELQQGELNMRQEFQMVYGTFKSDTSVSAISDGRLNGNMITFNIDDSEYKGKVTGNTTMKGLVTTGSAAVEWVAKRK